MIALSIVRVLQLIFSVIVLALSITAVRWQVYGKAPASSGYNAFAGAWGTLFALIGLAAAFVASVPGLVVAAFDGLTFIILLAGGIAYAVQVRGVQCSSTDETSLNSGNPLLYYTMNGGINDNGVVGVPYTIDSEGYPHYDYSVAKSHCTTILADDVFLFLAAFLALAAAVLVFISHRRGGTRHAAV